MDWPGSRSPGDGFMKKPINAFTYYLYKFTDCNDLGIVDTKVNIYGDFTVRVLEGCYITDKAHPTFKFAKDNWYGFSEKQAIKGFNKKRTLLELQKNFRSIFYDFR